MNKTDFSKLFPKFPFELPLLLDGATGTELIKAGMPTGICPEEWILQNPNVIQTIQKNYIDAGSDAVYAPTFGVNRISLARYGLSEKTVEMNRALAALSQEIVKPNGKLIGGDLSPTGKLLAPFGDADFEEIVSVYAEQVTSLRSFVDFFIIETNMDLATTRAAVIAAKENSDKPICVTMTVEKNGKTMSGDDPTACLLTLADLDISAFGLNCSTGPQEMAALLRPLLPLSFALGIPLIAKPNAGAPSENGEHHHLSAEEFAAVASEMLESGIMILGGCCGTTPDTIKAMRSMMEMPHEISSVMPQENASDLICTARKLTVIDRTDIPDAIIPEDEDDFPDEASDIAEEYGYANIRLRSLQDAELVLSCTPFFSFPITVVGEKDAIAYLRRHYTGKLLVI